MATTSTNLPHWDMTVIYPGLDSPEFATGFQTVTGDIANLATLFDEEHIGKREPQPLDDATVQTFERIIARYNEVLAAYRTLSAYIHAFVSTDSRDNLAQAKYSELQAHSVKLYQLGTRFTAWIGSLDVEGLIARSAVAAGHAHMLRQAKVEAEHLMSPAEEALAAELNVTGGAAWAKLHGNVTSQLSVPIELDGVAETLPMSVIRNLAADPSREIRRRAYEAELATWERVAVPLAAAMNSIKGEVNTLSSHRGWATPLDEALFEASIDRQTLDAMFTAARESFPVFRRYLHAKARALGLPVLAWYDLIAPVGDAGRAWSFDAAHEFIVAQFGSYSARLSDYAARAFREHWIDAEPRPGKRDGAFCMPIRRDESRVFANFKANYDGMSTLAHELGHGYHNMNLAPRTMLQRSTPMTLAETASIFCETIVREAALQHATPAERIEMLEASLVGSCQVVVDITSRFLFEQGVFETRRTRELSVDELNAMMLQAQRETYGDGLDPNQLHPYMWAMKPHYYSTGRSFYNFPYMFGLLFGLGLYARYRQDPDAFRAQYDDLLASTGLADAATLAARFGIDTRTPDFWRASLSTIAAEVDQFENAVGAR
ncbi:MAG TPA: M3 family oligoendopeptidase [Ktedonobacterales bacterium]|nr:M3 family oligoendopeptidase [Ktedonobacterales bacterium]